MAEGAETTRAKLVIELERTPDFKKLVEKFNKERETREPRETDKPRETGKPHESGKLPETAKTKETTKKA